MLMIIAGMLATLISLFMIHRRQRDQEREKRIQYWREQVGKCAWHCISPYRLT